MINKRALLFEVWCTLINLNFIYFKIGLQVLGAPNGFVPPKKLLLEALYWLTAPSNIHLSYSALKTNEEELTPAFTQNHHGCLVASNGLPTNDFLYLLSETEINVISTTFVCCGDSDLLYISKLRPFYLASHTHWLQCQPCCENHCVVA